MKTLILSLTLAMSLIGGISAASADNFPGYGQAGHGTNAAGR